MHNFQQETLTFPLIAAFCLQVSWLRLQRRKSRVLLILWWSSMANYWLALTALWVLIVPMFYIHWLVLRDCIMFYHTIISWWTQYSHFLSIYNFCFYCNAKIYDVTMDFLSSFIMQSQISLCALKAWPRSLFMLVVMSWYSRLWHYSVANGISDCFPYNVASDVMI